MRRPCSPHVARGQKDKAEGQGRVGEADGRAERALLLGLGRDTM